MPRHLIRLEYCTSHEWSNEIPSLALPTGRLQLVKPQPRERAWKHQRGKKTLLSLSLKNSEIVKSLRKTSISGSFGKSEIPRE